MEPSKEDKKKLLNDKLNALMQKKGLTLPAKLVTPSEPPKPQPAQKPIEKQVQVQKPTKAPGPEKTKQIKKEEKPQKKNVVLRKAAGEVWQDKTMEEWPENDYRIFVGNLGKETNDEVLATVFRNRYSSFNMARVVQDKRTGRTKGYGFVSFSHPRDFLNALKEMNGQYIGNRPAKVTKSTWKDRDIESARNQLLPSDFKKNAKKETNKIFTDFKYVHPY